ncbi:MAG: hypothetical protein ACTSRG_16960 [Candidatus Helarchaeota archaeon]
MTYKYGDIPDTIRTKKFYPVGRHMWRLYTNLGWEYLESMIEPVINEVSYPLAKLRLDEAIYTAKGIMEGRIKNPEKVMADTLFPPGGFIRSDLQQGSMKLYYGESVDCTYVVCRDDTEEVIFMINGHLEDGIPVDWWMVGPDDELLERRHLKMGIKLKQIPKRTKNFPEAGSRFLDVLRDVRNERTPQWSSSMYQVGIAWGTSADNLIFAISSYEGLAGLFDGISTKTLFNLGDYWFIYVPMPPIINTMIYAGRERFTLMTSNLMSHGNLYFQHIEDEYIAILKEKFAEIYDAGFRMNLEENGVPYPIQTLKCQLPDFRKKKTYENEDFDFKYGPGPWITLDDLQIDLEDAHKGYFFSINHETKPGEFNKEKHLISSGIGRNTEFAK